MNSEITQWIAQVTEGDEAAAEKLFDRYFKRLVALASKKLTAVPSPVADDEGAVISAFRSFFSGVEAGQFPRLAGEDDLWRVLATITVRKAIAQIRRHWKQKGEAGHLDRTTEVAEQLNQSLTPAEIAAFVEDSQKRIDALEEHGLKQIALLRLEGYDTREIASKLDVHQRTIQRKLQLIETLWLQECRE